MIGPLLWGVGGDPPTILFLIMCSIVSYKHSTQWLDLLCGDGDPPNIMILYSDYTVRL